MSIYFVAIVPPLDIQEQIKRFKLELKKHYGTKKSLKLPAHITVQIPFKINSEKEKQVLNLLAGVAQDNTPFEVGLSGFGCFPPRVIFVKVSNHFPIIQLHRNLQASLKKIVTLEKDGRNDTIHPHINIASRDLKKVDFQNAWKEFKDREYKAAFLAEEFVLFRHNDKSWDLMEEFQFQ